MKGFCMEKMCKWCHQVKPLDEFPKHPQMPDGHINRCKPCRNEWHNKHRQNPDIKEKRKNEFQNPEVKRRYKNSEKGKIAAKRYKTPKDRMSARNAVRYALKTGKLFCEPCFVCGEKGQAHHSSYAPEMKLVVTWLCQLHHNEVHLEHEGKRSWVNT